MLDDSVSIALKKVLVELGKISGFESLINADTKAFAFKVQLYDIKSGLERFSIIREIDNRERFSDTEIVRYFLLEIGFDLSEEEKALHEFEFELLRGNEPAPSNSLPIKSSKHIEVAISGLQGNDIREEMNEKLPELWRALLLLEKTVVSKLRLNL